MQLHGKFQTTARTILALTAISFQSCKEGNNENATAANLAYQKLAAETKEYDKAISLVIANGNKDSEKIILFKRFAELVDSAVKQGYWITGNSRSKSLLLSPIIETIEFTSTSVYGMANKGQGVLKVFDPAIFPEVSKPIKVFLINCIEAKHFKGETMMGYAVVNQAGFYDQNSLKSQDGLQVFHDEVSGVILHKSGLITHENKLLACPRNIPLANKLTLSNLWEFSELVSCACGMDINPSVEIQRLLDIRISMKVSRRYAEDISYRSATELLLNILQQQPGADKFKEELKLLVSGPQTAGKSKEEDFIARTEAYNILATSADSFREWFNSVSRAVADQFVQETKLSLSELARVLK